MRTYSALLILHSFVMTSGAALADNLTVLGGKNDSLLHDYMMKHVNSQYEARRADVKGGARVTRDDSAASEAFARRLLRGDDVSAIESLQQPKKAANKNKRRRAAG